MRTLLTIVLTASFSALANNNSVELLQSGQTTSYLQNDDGTTRFGIEWNASERFIDNNDGTITDTATNIMWLKDAQCLERGTWQQSLKQIKLLNEKRTGSNCREYSANYTDWHLPNFFEMTSLFSAEARKEQGEPWLSRVGFVGYHDILLTSTTTPENVNQIFLVNPGGGYESFTGGKVSTIYYYTAARVVTGKQLKLPRTGATQSYENGDDGDLKLGITNDERFIDNQRRTGETPETSNGTITDTVTRLMWLKDHLCFGDMTYEQANTAISTFNQSPSSYPCRDYSAAYSDWRMPSMFEYLTLQNVTWKDDDNNPFENDFKNSTLTSTIFNDEGQNRIFKVSALHNHTPTQIVSIQSPDLIKLVRSLPPGEIRAPFAATTSQSLSDIQTVNNINECTFPNAETLCAIQHKSGGHIEEGGFKFGLDKQANDTFAWDINAQDNDIEAALDVVSVATGTIIDIRYDDTYDKDTDSFEGLGDYILIEHEYRGTKWYSFYLHLRVNRNLPAIGSEIEANTFLGRTKQTQYSPHLHFVIYNKRPNEFYESVDAKLVFNDGETGGAYANTAPVAQDDSSTTTVGNSVTIDVTSNDTDADTADIITIISVSMPINGTTEIADGKITYAPNDSFVGVDEFEYSIKDTFGKTASAKVTVTVEEATNNAPVAMADQFTLTANSVHTLDVLENDSDTDGNTLTITAITSEPLNGATTIVDNKIVYEPNENFVGNDQFEYQISDGFLTNKATVTLVIEQENLAPQGVNDEFEVFSGIETSLDVLTNDLDEDVANLSIVKIVDEPLNGIATISDNSIVYKPNDNFVGNDSLTYELTDGSLTDTATVTIRVVEVNQAPQAIDDSFTITQATTATLDVLANDNDDDKSTLSISQIIEEPSNGTVSIINNTIQYSPNSTFVGNDELTYELTDGEFTATAKVSLTVTAAPTPPDNSSSSSSGGGSLNFAFIVLLFPLIWMRHKVNTLRVP